MKSSERAFLFSLPEYQEARWLFRWAMKLESTSCGGSKSHQVSRAFSLTAEAIVKASAKRPQQFSVVPLVRECAAKHGSTKSTVAPSFPDLAYVVSIVSNFASISAIPEAQRIAESILRQLGTPVTASQEIVETLTCARDVFSLVVKAAATDCGTRFALIGEKSEFLVGLSKYLKMSQLSSELAILDAAVSVHDGNPQTLVLIHQRVNVVSSLVEQQVGDRKSVV